MGSPELRISLLSFVPPGPFAAALNDFEITRWLTPVPFPYTIEDAKTFLAENARNGRQQAIWWRGRFAGGVGCQGELGYWVARPFWGNGIATGAARLILTQHFAVHDHCLSSFHQGNQASAHVLEKLGFRHAGTTMVTPRSTMLPILCHQMRLERADFRAKG